jgi:hypothetical protein
MARRLADAIHPSDEAGTSFSGAETARALTSVAENGDRRPKRRNGGRKGHGDKGATGLAAKKAPESQVPVELADKGPLTGPATPEEISSYTKEAESDFSELNVSTEDQLLSVADSYNDLKEPDGILERGVIDSSVVLAADGRKVVLSRNQFGDAVLQQMKEAVHRLSSEDDKVEDRYIFVPAADAEAFLKNLTIEKDIKEAGYVVDKNVARMAAERELLPRLASDAEKERAKVDEDILKFQLNRLESTEASGLVIGPESELVDPEVTKAKLVEQARQKLEQANNRLQTAVDLGNRVGNAASSEFLAARERTSETVANLTVGLNKLDQESKGHVSVFASSNQESNEVVFETFAAMTGQTGAPFMERNVKDAGSGIMVKELYYHTDRSERIVQETWNNSTGRLISATLVQCKNPTDMKADPGSTHPMTMLRGEVRRLFGREPKLEGLSKQAMEELAAAMPQDNAPYESSGGSNGDYGSIADHQFRGSFAKLHPGIELPKKTKPKKRTSWFERVFNRA